MKITAVDSVLLRVPTAKPIALSLPTLEPDLSPALRSELAALPLLSDAELHAIAHSTLDERRQAQLQDLAEACKLRPLTELEQSLLDQLMNEAERVMLRKAEAYRLLARRGYAIFSASEAPAN